MSRETLWFPCAKWDCNQQLPLYADRCDSCEYAHQQWDDRFKIVCPDCGRQISPRHDTCYCGEPLSRWHAVIQMLSTYESRQDFAVAKQGITHPELMEGFEGSIGLDLTPDANYRLSLEDTERGLHVKEYPQIYKVHLDEFDPRKNLIAHWVNDAPVATAFALAGGLAYLSAGSD